MIKKMRLTFIGIATSALLLLLIIIFGSINLYMKEVTLSQVDDFLEDVITNGGHIRFPLAEMDINKPTGVGNEMSGFSVSVSEKNQTISILGNSADVSNGEITLYTQKALAKNGMKGDIEGFRYLIRTREEDYIIVFGDTSSQSEILTKLLRYSFLVGTMTASILFILIIWLSGYITKPIEVAFTKQKRFIADSSHELKTPLSIMSANLDILEMDIGGNSRTDAMKKGIKRMSNLIHELLILAKTEQDNMIFLGFNLGQVMESTILPLEVIAYEQGNKIETFIEDGVTYNGNEEGIRKMIGALMENAIKYSRKNTTIKGSLYEKGPHKIIEIYNEGIGVKKEEKEKLFDKFYRVDHSRHRETGGHGIGLSIVKSVVEAHHGKIHVDSVPSEYIMFRITL